MDGRLARIAGLVRKIAGHLAVWLTTRPRGTAPTTKKGIEKYLGSDMVKGIGPIYAKKLVERFGERIFDIIEQKSARLENVDGIGPKRRQRIKRTNPDLVTTRSVLKPGRKYEQAVKAFEPYDGYSPIEFIRARRAGAAIPPRRRGPWTPPTAEASHPRWSRR